MMVIPRSFVHRQPLRLGHSCFVEERGRGNIKHHPAQHTSEQKISIATPAGQNSANNFASLTDGRYTNRIARVGPADNE